MAITGYKSKALRRLALRQDARGVSPEHLARIKKILALLDGSNPLADLSAATYGLHRLRGGELKGAWAVKMSANWRITFHADGRMVYDVDLIDYH